MTNQFSIYLRDAGFLVPHKDPSRLERIKRCADACADSALGMQMTLSPETLACVQFLKNCIPEKIPSALVHLHCGPQDRFGANDLTKALIAKVRELSEIPRAVEGVCLHPDRVENFAALEKLLEISPYVGIEVLDSTVKWGNRFAHIDRLLKDYPFLDLVLDTAHLQDMEAFGEPGLCAYVEAFGDRIREIHVSRHGNFYDMRQMEPGFDTSHSLLAVSSSNLLETLSALSLPRPCNLVIEGVAPYGPYGQRLLNREIQLFSAAFNAFSDQRAFPENRKNAWKPRAC